MCSAAATTAVTMPTSPAQLHCRLSKKKSMRLKRNWEPSLRRTSIKPENVFKGEISGRFSCDESGPFRDAKAHSGRVHGHYDETPYTASPGHGREEPSGDRLNRRAGEVDHLGARGDDPASGGLHHRQVPSLRHVFLLPGRWARSKNNGDWCGCGIRVSGTNGHSRWRTFVRWLGSNY